MIGGGRVGDRVLLGGWLLVLWCLLWGKLTAAVVLSGLVIAPTALAVSRLPVLAVRMRPRARRLPGVLASLVADIALSSVDVAAASLSRRTPHAAVVAVSLPRISDVETTIIANRISMVPGTLVIDVDRATDTLYVYVVPVRDEDDARHKEQHAVRIAEQMIRLFSSVDHPDRRERS